jgi:hypothetical protein
MSTAGAAGAAASGAAGGTASGAAGTAGSGLAGEGPIATAGSGPPTVLDVGRVSVHRLNNFEYDNTMRDLVGVDGMAQKTFMPDEEGEFDNDADAFTLNDARFQAYFDAADRIGETVFADTSPTGLRQAYVYGLVTPPCTPSATDATCSTQIIAAFAQKAWRHPLTTDDLQGLVKLAADALALGETADGALKQVVKVLLASPRFLYRVEADPDPSSLTPHALDPYELATRLAYLVWSSMPDATLFALAASGEIRTPAILQQQVDRMLADPKGNALSQSFAGQWLGVRDLQSHQVEPTAFPSFDEPLRAAMAQEEYLYFDEFLTGTRSMRDFFSAPINFVNTRLAKHYGFPAVDATAGFQQVTNGDPHRIGFLGLGSLLTFTSYSYRTSPTIRGKWVFLNLLCQPIPAPPANVPTLDPGPLNVMVAADDVRGRLRSHLQSATCAACHALIDPIGFGLENFDGIGVYRTKYSGGTVIDASGMLPTGETFSGFPQMVQVLSSGGRVQDLLDCASRKLMTYALSRSLTATDTPYLNQVRTTWAGQGFGIKPLLKDIVVNDTFRFRRGEAP